MPREIIFGTQVALTPEALNSISKAEQFLYRGKTGRVIHITPEGMARVYWPVLDHSSQWALKELQLKGDQHETVARSANQSR